MDGYSSSNSTTTTTTAAAAPAAAAATTTKTKTIQFFIYWHAECSSQWPVTESAQMQRATARRQTQGQKKKNCLHLTWILKRQYLQFYLKKYQRYGDVLNQHSFFLKFVIYFHNCLWWYFKFLFLLLLLLMTLMKEVLWAHIQNKWMKNEKWYQLLADCVTCNLCMKEVETV